MFFSRFALVLSVAVFASLALAVAGIAAGGGIGPGNYSSSSSRADASFGSGGKGLPPSVFWNVDVFQGINSFKPHSAGLPMVQQSTVVYIVEFDVNGNGGFGCFVVPDSDFTVSHDLQSASLHAVLTADEMCPGDAAPVDGSGKGAVPGVVAGLSLPLTVDVTWTATTAVSSFQDAFTFRCLNYGGTGTDTFQTAGASALGAISTLTGQFVSNGADMTSGSDQLAIHNVPPDACF